MLRNIQKSFKIKQQEVQILKYSCWQFLQSLATFNKGLFILSARLFWCYRGKWDVTVCSYSNLLDHLLIYQIAAWSGNKRGQDGDRTGYSIDPELAGWLSVMFGISWPREFLVFGAKGLRIHVNGCGGQSRPQLSLSPIYRAFICIYVAF